MKEKINIKEFIRERATVEQLHFLDKIYKKLFKNNKLFNNLVNTDLFINNKEQEQIQIENSVTVILCGYKRPHVLDEQYLSVLNQTHKPSDVMFWKNESLSKVKFDERTFKKMKSVISNHNFGVWARFSLALNCKTKFVCILDDDTVPGSKWLENCIESFNEKPGLYGTIGLVYKSEESYSGAQRYGWTEINNEEIKEVDIVGHAWFFERNMLSYFWRELPEVDDFYVGEDMHFSHMLQKYSDFKTYVPPHPKNDRTLWGSVKGEYGEEAVATASFAVPLMDTYYKKIIKQGFKIINTKK